MSFDPRNGSDQDSAQVSDEAESVTTSTPWPGIGLAAAIAGVSYLVNALAPTVSPLLIAIVIGVAVSHLLPLSKRWEPGLAFTARRALRLGIVLLGLQLSLRDIASLGPRVIALAVCVVVFGVVATTVLGLRLGLTRSQSLVIACGFSICGAAAVAAAEEESEADETEVATAIALVVIFGSVMIGLVPLLAHALHLSAHDGGVLAGASIHEIAQVVAAAGILGNGSLASAILVKFARVLMLAPVLVALGWLRRRRTSAVPAATDQPTRRQPPIPLFIACFLGAIVVRTVVPLPTALLSVAQVLQTALLAAAMAALGCGVHIRLLRKVGVRPVILAACATGIVLALALLGTLALR